MEETDDVEFESPHPAAARPAALAHEAGSARTDFTLRASWQPSPPEIARHPRAHPTLVLAANRDLDRQQDFTSLDVL
jgi:hypothetical protein